MTTLAFMIKVANSKANSKRDAADHMLFILLGWSFAVELIFYVAIIDWLFK